MLSGNAAIGKAGGDGITNYGSGQGGGINDFDNLTVVNSTLICNQALGTHLAPGAVPSQTPDSGSTTAGGGVFCLGVYVPDAAVIVADSTVTGNQAIGGAGAAGSAGSVGEGGGISLIAVPPALVVDCLVAGLASPKAGCRRRRRGGHTTGVSGGIDLSFGSAVNVSNTVLVWQSRPSAAAGAARGRGGDGVGGGINVGSGVITGSPDDCSLTLTDSILLSNQSHRRRPAGQAAMAARRSGRRPPSILAGSSRIDRFPHRSSSTPRRGWHRRYRRRERPGLRRRPIHRHNCRRDARQVDEGHFQLLVYER